MKTKRLRVSAGVSVMLLMAIVFIGGLARAVSLVAVGMPSKPMLGALVIELVVTPLLYLWQRRVARS